MSYQIAKNSPIENRLNVIIRRTIESGLMDYFARESVFRIQLAIAIKAHAAGGSDGEYLNAHGITMGHMGRVCLIFALIMFVAVAVFAIEIAYFNKTKIQRSIIRLLNVRSFKKQSA